MARVSIKEVREAFEVLFDALLDPAFRKTSDFRQLSERPLLSYIRFFLLGWFGDVAPEARARLAAGRSGRFDFLVGNTAIEVAVKSSSAYFGNPLAFPTNYSEIVKLLKHDGPSILVLLDFSKKPAFPEKKSLDAYYGSFVAGKGNHKTSSFTVLYYRNVPGPDRSILLRV